MASQEKKSLTFWKMADVNVETFLEVRNNFFVAVVLGF